jgi:hypothetical protein
MFEEVLKKVSVQCFHCSSTTAKESSKASSGVSKK